MKSLQLRVIISMCLMAGLAAAGEKRSSPAGCVAAVPRSAANPKPGTSSDGKARPGLGDSDGEDDDSGSGLPLSRASVGIAHTNPIGRDERFHEDRRAAPTDLSARVKVQQHLWQSRTHAPRMMPDLAVERCALSPNIASARYSVTKLFKAGINELEIQIQLAI